MNVKPLKVLQTSTEYQEALANLENDWEVSDKTRRSTEAFTSRIYGQKKQKKLTVST